MECPDDGMSVMLDVRMGVGGAARCGRLLARGLFELDEPPRVVLVERASAGPRRVLTTPYTPWARRLVARRARRASVDVVHNLSFESPPVGRPLVVTVNDVIPLEHPSSMPSPLRRAEFRRLLRDTIRRADAVLVPSGRTAASLVAHVGSPRGHLVTVRHAVDPVFRPASPEERAVARHRFAEGRRYVAALGTSRAHKNLAVLSHASMELPRRFGAELVLRGPAPAGFAGRTIDPLNDEDLRLLYAGASTVVVCSHVEGFGYPAVEAAACGVPVVCGADLGALEVLDGAVVVTDVSDPVAVCDAVAAILDGGVDVDELAAAGRAATADLTPRAVAAATFEVYRRVVR